MESESKFAFIELSDSEMLSPSRLFSSSKSGIKVDPFNFGLLRQGLELEERFSRG